MRRSRVLQLQHAKCAYAQGLEMQQVGEEEKFRRLVMAGVPAPIMDIRLIGNDGSEQSWDGASVGEI